jgi:hypothetical protein
MEIARAVLVVNDFQDQVSIERWDSERSGTWWWLPCSSGAEIVASFVIMVGSFHLGEGPDWSGTLPRRADLAGRTGKLVSSRVAR